MTSPTPFPEPASLQPEGGDPLDWRSSLREHNPVRAEARYRALVFAGQGDPAVLSGLEALLEWRRAIRSKRYAEAFRTLPALEPLRAELALPELSAATQALLETERERIVDEEVLRRTLEPALSHPVTRAEACNQIGVLQALQAHPDEARQSFQAALEADPEHHRALTNLGNLLLEGGNAHAAEAHYRQAIALEPEYALAHNNLAAALRRQKRVSESVRAMKKSRSLENRKLQHEARQEIREHFGGRGLPTWLAGRTGQYLMIGLALALVWFFFLRG